MRNRRFSAEFVSDRCTYQKIVKQLESDLQTPQFIFCVTMQNHLGYDISYDNFEEDITFPSDVQYPQAKQYLSLLKRSDQAIQELLACLDAQERPTYVLFFGDHQPAVEEGFYHDLRAASNMNDTLFEITRHSVPFFLWSNQGNAGTHYTQISVHYLAPLLLQTAGMRMTAYDSFLLQMMKTLPVLTAQGCIDSSGAFYPTDRGHPYQELINQYHCLQYNQVFDYAGRRDDLFTLS